MSRPKIGDCPSVRLFGGFFENTLPSHRLEDKVNLGFSADQSFPGIKMSVSPVRQGVTGIPPRAAFSHCHPRIH